MSSLNMDCEQIMYKNIYSEPGSGEMYKMKVSMADRGEV